MTTNFAALVLLLSLGFSAGSSASNSYENCATDKSALLRAIFDIEDNRYNMDAAFFPAKAGFESTRHIRVRYTFVDTITGEKDENCSVTFIWALGGFLLVQPPTIFQFNSLLFSPDAENMESLDLTLPIECQALVTVKEDGTCKCGKTAILDRITEQV